MAQQQSPFLEAAYGWNFGEGGWNSGMDQNLLKFSFMFDRNVDSIVASLPPAVNGQAYFLTTDNRLYFAVGTTYFSTPVPKWFTVIVRSTGQTHQFDGVSLVQTDTPVQLDSRIDAVELTVSTLGTAAFESVEFFATQAELDVAAATAASYTDTLRNDIAETANINKGASLVGFDGTTLDQQIKSKVNRVVDSITDLKALDKTKYIRAFLTGSSAAGDGGGGEYWLDASDTTSPDNGGSIIVANDGGRWKSVPLRKYLTLGTSQHDEIIKDSSPLNYGTTRAATVLQHRDTAVGAVNELIPGSVFQYNVTGDGVVNAGSELSSTIWQGLFAFMRKTGDGSAHSFTAIGELGAYGAGAYNELGLFQGEGTNNGSSLGTMSGVEMLLKDSPDGGSTTFSTKMQAVVGRIAKYNPTARKSYNFFASSEGTQAPNGILGVNSSGFKTWQRGFDFEGAVFSTGQFGLAPNNTTLAWLDAGSVARNIIGLSNTNVTFLRPGSNSATVDMQDFAGTTRLQVISSSGLVAFQNATVSASASAGVNGSLPAQVSGYLNIVINGSTKKIPYYDV